jgi:predicted Ser/Thr protein kinase
MTTETTNENVAEFRRLPRDPFPQGYGAKDATLRSFLKTVRKWPESVESTHATMYRLCALDGIDEQATAEARRITGNESLIAFRRVTQRFFGVEEPVYDILVGYARQAKEGGRAHRKALIIPGAPGAGKSDFVNFLQRAIMRSCEPKPYLKFSANFCNPLNALYLAKIIAQTKAHDMYDATLAELVDIINDLDLTGESALNTKNTNFVRVAGKYGVKSGDEVSTEKLAEICMADEKDFVAVVCYGLDLPVATVDSLSPSANLIDPFVKDVVLGRFFGKVGPKAKPADTTTEGKSKSSKHPTYGDYDADFACKLGDFPIDNMFMSKGQGIVDVAEVQPINFDIDVWRGRTSMKNMGIFDDEDPRTIVLNGYFNVGKFMVLTEIFRNPPEGFRVLLESLEGGRLPLPDSIAAYYPEGIHWEGVMIGHANMEQWQKFYGNADHRAHLDRFSPKPFIYPLRPTAAAKVTEKLYAASDLGQPGHSHVHHEPLSFKWAGYFRVATHLDWASKGNRPVMAVLQAYDGKQVRERMMGTDIDLRALRSMAPTSEGQTGMSPRNLDDLIGQLAAEALTAFQRGERPAACFTTAELRDRLKESFRTNDSMSKKDKELWTGWLDNQLETFRRQELTKVYKAAFIPSFRDLCMQYFRKYVAYVRALALGIKPTNLVGGQAVTTRDMEAFLQEVERADEFNVNSAGAPKFRQGVMAAINLFNEEHGTADVPYDVHEGLKTCIESYVLRQAKDITGVVGITNTDEEQTKKLNDAKSRLEHEHGYCKYCAEKLLIEVALTRDFLKA